MTPHRILDNCPEVALDSRIERFTILLNFLQIWIAMGIRSHEDLMTLSGSRTRLDVTISSSSSSNSTVSVSSVGSLVIVLASAVDGIGGPRVSLRVSSSLY